MEGVRYRSKSRETWRGKTSVWEGRYVEAARGEERKRKKEETPLQSVTESLVLPIGDIHELNRDLDLLDGTIFTSVLDVTEFFVLLARGGLFGVAALVLADEVEADGEDDADVGDVGALGEGEEINGVSFCRRRVRGSGETYELDGPWNHVTWAVLNLPELSAEDLAQSVADEEDGVDSHFLKKKFTLHQLNHVPPIDPVRAYSPWCGRRRR